MHVVIVGCGRVGSGLAARFEAEGDSVAVIDRSPTAFGRLGSDFAGRTIAGIGFDRDRLVDAGIEEAGALAAVTNGDNSNILVARVARETFGVERVVARIYDPHRADIYQRLGIPTIASAQWTTDQVMRRMQPARTAAEWSDPSAGVALVERPVVSTLAGKTIDDIDLDGAAHIVALSRLGRAQLTEPGLVLQEGDIMYLIVVSSRVDDLTGLLEASGGRH